MLHTSDFDFELPTELIASHPLERRDASRMLVVAGGAVVDKHIRDFLDYLQPGDVVVFNNSRVIPARFNATKNSPPTEGGTASAVGRVEITLHTAKTDHDWWGLCKKFNKIQIGDTLTMDDGTKIRVIDRDEESGLLLHFDCDNVFDVLNAVGKMPLPPYMKRDEEISDRERYQTVYAEPLGSMAAPTAGLHFTDELMDEIEKRGAKIVKITLHVGAGTWMPVKTENLDEHKMHSEWCCITPEQADIINNATRVIAVGTTSMRTLESAHQLAIQQSCRISDEPRPCGGVAEHAQLCDAMRGRVQSHQYRSENIQELASNMRQKMTDAEKKLWYAINKKQLDFQFRRQYIIDNKYIADFICLEKKLIIEVDGSQHIENKKDEQRTQYLQQFGFNVIRFWNWDVNENLDGCVQVIWDVLHNDSFEKRLAKFKEQFVPAPDSTDASHRLVDPAARAGLTPKCRTDLNPALAEKNSNGTGWAKIPRVLPICQQTNIFITPGYEFGAVDVLLTNFHLPKSTLFMLVSAFAGLAEMKTAYAHAVAEKYRFFSYGDCCLLFKKDAK